MPLLDILVNKVTTNGIGRLVEAASMVELVNLLCDPFARLCLGCEYVNVFRSEQLDRLIVKADAKCANDVALSAVGDAGSFTAFVDLDNLAVG